MNILMYVLFADAHRHQVQPPNHRVLGSPTLAITGEELRPVARLHTYCHIDNRKSQKEVDESLIPHPRHEGTSVWECRECHHKTRGSKCNARAHVRTEHFGETKMFRCTTW
jgi:hypothetical protein